MIRSKEEKLAILKQGKESGIKAVCQAVGVSESLFYNWRRKFEAGGIEALEHKKRWNTHQTLADIQIPNTDWTIQGLKRASNLAADPLSPWYRFDLLIGDRWALRGFSYNSELNKVFGFSEVDPRGRRFINEPLGDTAKGLALVLKRVVTDYYSNAQV